MTIKIALCHRTSYRFAAPATLGPHLIRLRPAPHTRTHIMGYSLEVAPDNHQLHWQQDPFGNWQARVFFLGPAEHFDVTVDLLAELAVVDPFDFYVEPEASTWPFAYAPDLALDLGPYLETDPAGPALSALLASIDRTPTYTVGFLVALNQRLADDIAYEQRLEPGIQTIEETLERRIGSCRDTGWLMVQLCRQLAIAARFVSGYLVQLKGDAEAGDGPDEDFLDLHAWAEIYLPGAGWIGLDPTSGMLAGEGHIPLAASPRPDHAAPITGTASEVSAGFAHAMTVTRLAARPRPSTPFATAEWTAISTLAGDIDARAAAAGLELKLGRGSTIAPTAGWDAHLAALEGHYATAAAGRYRPDGLPATTAPWPVVLDGPLAQRPELLASLIRYWQRHPALSYLLSGGRIGVDGPAPRLDELGAERLAEVALTLATGAGLADLLTDATGDPQGAELAFAAETGQLAIRSFGEPPSPRMAALELLLVQALIVRFAAEPCRLALDAQDGLHDRWLLPYWLLRDLDAVLAELADFGLAFEPAWFAAHAGLRTPLLGTTEIAGVRLELRAALEPWCLLAAGPDGTRLIDDSLDRLEVRVLGEIARHHVVTCNGWALPLAPAPDGGQIAGVRFRARSLPRMLHPSLGVTAELTFDLVDTRLGRSLGGCRYHAGKPDGSAYDAPPINDLAAEPRRLARFEPMRHTAGMIQPRRAPALPHQPHTLDLRHARG